MSKLMQNDPMITHALDERFSSTFIEADVNVSPARYFFNDADLHNISPISKLYGEFTCK